MSCVTLKDTDKMMEVDESWRDGSWAERNLHMLDAQLLTDCTFVVGITEKKKFQCHKYVLCQGSSVFYAMFNGDLKEKGDVKVEDIEPQHFRKMIEFIYSDKTDLGNVETALSVCYAANKYMINTLTLKCIDFSKKNLNEEIACKTLEFARLIDNADLEAESLQYLQFNTSEVFNSASFPNVEKTTLLIILNQDDLCVDSEVEVFSACIRWAKAQQRDDKVVLRDVLGLEVLGLVRFLTMTCEEFATVVVPSKVLHVQEACDLMCCIAKKSGFMPQGFNINTTIRTSVGPKESIEVRTSSVYSHIGQQLNSYPFTFSIDVEGFIYGLQLRGPNSSPAVEDKFEVDLMLASKILASAKFEGLMAAGKTVEINFKKRVVLKANTNYNLNIKISNVNASYTVTDNGHKVHTSTAGVKMKTSYSYTNISKIYIAKKIK
ncbi:hypothetical protein B566_EDAN007024 [Ephemera danica]|nr:hypothetical protein B566_EDAN007024 [Ephemera danica]